MKDYTVQGYLEKLSNEELEVFLRQCMQLHRWDSYVHVIPQIMTILKNRGRTVAKPIWESWETYRNEEQKIGNGSLS